MGGSAFSAILAASAFPRLPPAVYQALKAKMIPKISQFYTCVGVPLEAPEKLDYGDLDLLVTIPAPGFGAAVPHDAIRKAIGAKYANEMEGNRTSNYAVPIRVGEWGSLGHGTDEKEKRAIADNGEIYYQVDIHNCIDKAEYSRVSFFNSYGDLGMILGLIARNSGLALGVKGLKLPNPPNPPLHLTDSFDDITSFFGLSLQTYNKGFKTKKEVYEWAVSTKYFDPAQFRSSGLGFTKVKPQRTMYSDFVTWVEMSNASHLPNKPRISRECRHAKVREEALIYFNKKQEFEALSKARSDRSRLKESFSGSLVRDWTKLGECGKGVKLIMDEVRRRLGGEDGVLEYLDKHGEDGVKKFVREVQVDLGIQSNAGRC
ncbi:hypothetical protein BDN70DRAFT_990382 [Pholiota conissans]|uniref:Uncharacterized protein n=1 Tax=Pholiota conissans TaxID=109636 RepID=A0A9P5ZCP4_9AGAR|nr:hypothetical protein BDN70DRAFT_990382 [Pholiota conissans]